ncbi:hypothetical protein TNCV_2989341 [Trichonephila clavipes]|nr:hypothetical protein TNCV_2989341 [Trichonephila clavipes]
MEADVARISSDTLKKVWDELACQLDVYRVTNEADIEHLQNRSNFRDDHLAVPNDPRYARLETNLGIGNPRKGSNSAETVL